MTSPASTWAHCQQQQNIVFFVMHLLGASSRVLQSFVHPCGRRSRDSPRPPAAEAQTKTDTMTTE